LITNFDTSKTKVKQKGEQKDLKEKQKERAAPRKFLFVFKDLSHIVNSLLQISQKILTKCQEIFSRISKFFVGKMG
jgi:hypothetical protein